MDLLAATDVVFGEWNGAKLAEAVEVAAEEEMLERTRGGWPCWLVFGLESAPLFVKNRLKIMNISLNLITISLSQKGGKR